MLCALPHSLREAMQKTQKVHAARETDDLDENVASQRSHARDSNNARRMGNGQFGCKFPSRQGHASVAICPPRMGNGQFGWKCCVPPKPCKGHKQCTPQGKRTIWMQISV